jgi:chemotaxis signal transduction protein
VSDRASDMRRAFDLGFAMPPADVAGEVVDVLAIRVAGEPYAIRLLEIGALIADRKIVPLPSSAPDLLGLAGIRGGLVPVFGLASILGHGQGGDGARWMVIHGAHEPIALAFSELEGHLRLPRADIHAAEAPRADRPYLREVAHTPGGIRAVIDVPLLVAAIHDRPGRERPGPEG